MLSAKLVNMEELKTAQELKDQILRYNSKKAQCDTKYVSENITKFKYNINYIQFLKDVQEILNGK